MSGATSAGPGSNASHSSYDQVPYDSLPFAQTHPDRMATLARLFGLQPAPLAGCRVLELGCAGGGNLVPMALALPGAQFVGVDLSSVQVAQGQALIADLGLKNIELLACSITDIDASLGQFDYILTHGVYSWVPDTVQQRILDICARQLAPGGVAYVSYNTLPGWHMRGTVRDLMRFHAMRFADPGQRVLQARAIVDFLSQWVPSQDNAHGMVLKSELQSLRSAPDYYILHEHLEDINEPLYFHQFIERASGHGLQYLAEAEMAAMLASKLPDELGRILAHISSDVIRQEQFMDFLHNRTFRQTLLVHADAPIDRVLTPDRMHGLWVSGSLSPDSPTPELASRREESFRSAQGGLLKSPNPVTKAAMVLLARHWPRQLAFDALLDDALGLLGGVPDAQRHEARDVLASDLLQCHIAGLLELHAGPAAFVTAAGERPTASALARWQAARGLSHVTSLRHEPIRIDAATAQALQLLDGTRDLAALERDLRPHGVALRQLLDATARSALLVA